jgi:hypothetical protein
VISEHHAAEIMGVGFHSMPPAFALRFAMRFVMVCR